MFENIIAQARVVQALEQDIAKKTLPQSLLFVGPACSGKFSTALELARVLSCKTPGAPWNCECPACTMQRHFGSPYLMVAGRRSFMPEIRAAGDALLGDPRDPLRFLFLRCVRKLTRRFDPVLWEGEKNLPKAAKIVEAVEEQLAVLSPGKTQPVSADQLAPVFQSCSELLGLLPHDGIPAAMIRRMNYWAHTADASETKFILLEGAEHLNETARNAMLKILEEPPAGVYFILFATTRQGVMPTLLSRLRVFAFDDRGAEGDRQVVERVFRGKPEGPVRLGDWLRAADREASAVLNDLAAGFLNMLLCRSGLETLVSTGSGETQLPGSDELAPYVSACKDRLDDLVRTMLGLMRALLPRVPELEKGGPPWASDRLYRLITLVSRTGNQALAYNVSVSAFMDLVHARCGEELCDVSSSGH